MTKLYSRLFPGILYCGAFFSFFFFSSHFVHADNWTQTDWSGRAGQQYWVNGNDNQFYTGTNIDLSTVGEFKLLDPSLLTGELISSTFDTQYDQTTWYTPISSPSVGRDLDIKISTDEGKSWMDYIPDQKYGPSRTFTYKVILTSSDGVQTPVFQSIDIPYQITGLDTTPPVITLNGARIFESYVNVAYNDSGATAYDNIDGDLSMNITTNISSSNPDITSPGTYIIRYNVSDKAGNQAREVIRIVNITDMYHRNITVYSPLVGQTYYDSNERMIAIQYTPYKTISNDWDIDARVRIKVNVYNGTTGELVYSSYQPADQSYSILPYSYVTFTTPPLGADTYFLSFNLEAENGDSLILYKSLLNGFTIPNGPSAFIEASSYSGTPTLDTTLSAEINRSPFGTMNQYNWDFGDTTQGQGAIVQHSYPNNNEGFYTLSLETTDSLNNLSNHQIPVYVNGTSTPESTLDQVMLYTEGYDGYDVRYPNVQFAFIGELADHLLILRRTALTESELPNQTFNLLETLDNPNSFHFYDTSVPSNNYVQYQIKEMKEGYIISTHYATFTNSNNNSFYYNAYPDNPQHYIQPLPNSTVTTLYHDADNDNGSIGFRAIELPDGWYFENGYLIRNDNYNGTYENLIDCSDNSKVIASTELQANNNQWVNWRIPVGGTNFICAQAKDSYGNITPWYTRNLERETSTPIDGDLLVMVSILPSITSSGGGTNNVSPDIPQLISPVENTTFVSGNPIALTAKYTDFNNDDGYVFFRVSHDIDCLNAESEEKGNTVHSGETDTWTVPVALLSGTHYWCAKSFDAYGYDSPWSESWAFTVQSANTNDNSNGNLNTNQNSTSPVLNGNENTSTADYSEYYPVSSPLSPPTPLSVLESTPTTPQEPAPNNNSSTSTNSNSSTIPPSNENDNSKVDTDKDNATDFNETYIYGTDSNNPESAPTPFSHDVHISNIQDGDTVASDTLFVVGTATANNTVKLFVEDEGGTQQDIGSVSADSEGKFALSSLPLLPGTYKLYAKVYDPNGILIASSESAITVLVDPSIPFPSPLLSTLNGQEVPPSGGPLTVHTQKPVLEGEYPEGIDPHNVSVLAFWQSVVTGSEGNQTNEGNIFSVTPEEPLSLGDHSVTLYLIQTEGSHTILGKTVSLPFTIVQAPPEEPALTSPPSSSSGTSGEEQIGGQEPSSSSSSYATNLIQSNSNSLNWIFPLLGALCLIAATTIAIMYWPKKKKAARHSIK